MTAEMIKKITIKGGEEVLGRKKRGGGRTRKVGGSGALPTVASITDKTAAATVVANVANVANVAKAAVVQAAPQQQSGGSAIKQVKLEPKKTKVILEKSHSRKVTTQPHPTRKVRLAIHGIHKNIHKAKTIKNKAGATPIEEVKKELKAHGLWKEDSKAPDSILRNIYADFQILREKAL